MCIQWTRVLYSAVITRQSNPPIQQFNSLCNEFMSVRSMFVCYVMLCYVYNMLVKRWNYRSSSRVWIKLRSSSRVWIKLFRSSSRVWIKLRSSSRVWIKLRSSSRVWIKLRPSSRVWIKLFRSCDQAQYTVTRFAKNPIVLLLQRICIVLEIVLIMRVKP